MYPYLGLIKKESSRLEEMPLPRGKIDPPKDGAAEMDLGGGRIET